MPRTRVVRFRMVFIALVAVMSFRATALAADPQELINRARGTLAEMRQDRRFHTAERLRQAKAMMLIPELSRGGFLFGGQGGAGVLIVKRPDGEWSEPAFYSIGGGTFGLQVGFQTAQVVLLVMKDSVLQNWLQGDVTFGTQDGVAMFVKGTQYSEGKTSQGAGVIAWVRATGAYAGITVEGTSISFNRDDNRRYYGRSLSATEILIDGRGHSHAADELRAAASGR